MTNQTELLQNETQAGEILITRIFDAPRELVWKALTVPENLMRWWGPQNFTSPEAKIDLRVGGKYLFCMRSLEGQDFWSTGVYREIQAPERLVMTDSFADEHGNIVPASHYGMEGEWPLEMLITITLEEENGKTKLTLNHVGLPSAENSELTMGGWNESFDKLAASLSAANGGEEEELVITRTLNAPRELVFKAWTEAERLAQWWGPKGLDIHVEKLDLRPGGIFHYGMTTPDGQTMWGRFIFEEITAPERIVFINSFSDAEGGIIRAPFSATWPLEMRNVLTLTEENGVTTLTLRGGPINATAEERKTYHSMHASMQQGFSGTFEQLEQYLAKAK